MDISDLDKISKELQSHRTLNKHLDSIKKMDSSIAKANGLSPTTVGQLVAESKDLKKRLGLNDSLTQILHKRSALEKSLRAPELLALELTNDRLMSGSSAAIRVLEESKRTSDAQMKTLTDSFSLPPSPAPSISYHDFELKRMAQVAKEKAEAAAREEQMVANGKEQVRVLKDAAQKQDLNLAVVICTFILGLLLGIFGSK